MNSAVVPHRAQQSTNQPKLKNPPGPDSQQFLGSTLWYPEWKRLDQGRKLCRLNLLAKSIGDSDGRDQRRSNWLEAPGSGPQRPADRSCESVPVRLEWVSPFLVPTFAV